MTDPQHEETFADTERKLREIITTLRECLERNALVEARLRAQLAEARVEIQRLDGGWHTANREIFRVSLIAKEAEARADRAEQRVANLEAALSISNATLAAQIEVDACDCPDPAVCQTECFVSAIRNQPHDLTALDRMLAEAREVSEADKIAIRNKALREAADELRGQGYGAAVRTTLALIEKPQGGKFATNQSNGLATLQKEKPNDLS